VAIAALVAAACSGGGSGGGDGVASIDADDSGGASGDVEAQATSPEQQLLDYVACLREQGLDIPDPQVDADGNLVLNPEELFQGEDRSQAEIDRFAEDLQEAQGVCGEPPEGAIGGFDHGGDQTDFEDALLVFAQCMREAGVDIPDPDFSSPGGQAAFFGEFHRLENDPAFEPCQQEAFGPLGSGG
jgi:hypothetical protein